MTYAHGKQNTDNSDRQGEGRDLRKGIRLSCHSYYQCFAYRCYYYAQRCKAILSKDALRDTHSRREPPSPKAKYRDSGAIYLSSLCRSTKAAQLEIHLCYLVRISWWIATEQLLVRCFSLDGSLGSEDPHFLETPYPSTLARP